MASPGDEVLCLHRCPGSLWIRLTLAIWACAAIAFAIGYRVRLVALYCGWEESLARDPAGVYLHDDGRSLLGRKLKGKSKREMKPPGPDAGTRARPKLSS